MKRKNVLIIQNEITHYNKPLYNKLGEIYNITVLHSGTCSKEKDDNFNEIITKKIKIGPFIFQQNVLKEVRSKKYDVVIAMFDIKWVNNIIVLFLKNKKIKFIWWGHGYGRNKIGNKIRDLFIKKSDGIILYSDKYVNKMKLNAILESKIFIANNTLEVKNHGFCKDCKKSSFLFVGRAQKRKKVDLLLKAFAKIIDKIPSNITIDIVGDGEENIYLKKLAKELNIENRVIFHGTITDENRLKELFHKSFAYVSPGPVGLGVLHSLAYGIPVVTRKKEYHGPEFDNLNNNNSIVYNNDDELEAILLKFINNKELSYNLGKNGYELYSKKRTMDEMVNSFKQAIEGES